MVRFQRIISEFDEVVALSSEQGLRLICAGPATSELAGRARKELAVVGFARMLRHFCGRNGVPRGVAFDYSPPSYEAEYARVFEGRALFRQSWCGVDIPTELLDVPQPGWSLELYRVMEGHAEAALASMEGSLPIRARVARALHQAYPRWFDMSEVARELDVSERTLRRHLSREGLVFSEILAEVQCEIATRLLRDPNRTIQQVAYEMGFSSPSAFHRAFKRWTGQSPSEVRPASRRPPE
jgi:AraC-like DNA-binding protein